MWECDDWEGREVNQGSERGREGERKGECVRMSTRDETMTGREERRERLERMCCLRVLLEKRRRELTTEGEMISA